MLTIKAAQAGRIEGSHAGWGRQGRVVSMRGVEGGRAEQTGGVDRVVGGPDTAGTPKG